MVEKTEYGFKITEPKDSLSILLFKSNAPEKEGAKAVLAFNAIIRVKGYEFRVPVKKMVQSGEYFFGTSRDGKRVIVEEYDSEKGIAYPRAAIPYSLYEMLSEKINAALHQ